jgi:serine/threonine protein kinase
MYPDVKPDNILVNSAGEVHIIDFALSVRVQKKPAFFGRMFGKKKGKVLGAQFHFVRAKSRRVHRRSGRHL